MLTYQDINTDNVIHNNTQTSHKTHRNAQGNFNIEKKTHLTDILCIPRKFVSLKVIKSKSDGNPVDARHVTLNNCKCMIITFRELSFKDRQSYVRHGVG